MVAIFILSRDLRVYLLAIISAQGRRNSTSSLNMLIFMAREGIIEHLTFFYLEACHQVVVFILLLLFLVIHYFRIYEHHKNSPLWVWCPMSEELVDHHF